MIIYPFLIEARMTGEGRSLVGNRFVRLVDNMKCLIEQKW